MSWNLQLQQVINRIQHIAAFARNFQGVQTLCNILIVPLILSADNNYPTPVCCRNVRSSKYSLASLHEKAILIRFEQQLELSRLEEQEVTAWMCQRKMRSMKLLSVEVLKTLVK